MDLGQKLLQLVQKLGSAQVLFQVLFQVFPHLLFQVQLVYKLLEVDIQEQVISLLAWR